MRRLPLVILIVYVALAVLYSAIVPMFESPDENFHFAYIQRVVQFGDLPYQDAAVPQPWNQEGSQPPLYYLVASLVARFIPVDYIAYPLQINPLGKIGVGLASINNNNFLHTPQEAFPWRGVYLRFHLIRLLSVALGAFTVYAVYRTARLAIPDWPGVALLAMAFAAFNPMFLFTAASVNNDNLVTAFGAAASWLMLIVIREGYTTRRGALLAVILALASLSKISGLTLFAVYGALLVFLFFKRRLTFRQGVAAVLLLGVAFAVLTAWWYARNLQLYGDLTGLSRMIEIIKPRPNVYTIEVMLREMQGLRISFWALFGWLNVIGPNWFLTLMDILTALGTLGGIVWVARELRARRFDSLLAIGIIGLQFLVTFASLINWTRLTPGTQGRLLMPSIAAIATLTALGWYVVGRGMVRVTGKLVRQRLPISPEPAKWAAVGGEFVPFIPVLVMAVVAALSPFLTIAPAYALPPTVNRLPDDAVPVQVRFDKINILGFHIDPAPILPGDSLLITLYYQGEPDERNLSLYLTAFDRAGKEVGKIDTYPGRGMLPTAYLQPGSIYADAYRLKIDESATAPLQPIIEFGWWNLKTQVRVKPIKANGAPLDALILHGGTIISADPPPQPATVQQAVFSGSLRLNGYTLVANESTVKAGDLLHVSLNWEGLSRVYEDFTVFVHLEADDGTLIASGDGQPWFGHYPTSAWAPGHPFDDPHILSVPSDVPPGQYRLVIGLYRASDNTRLPTDSGSDSVTLQTPIRVQ